MDPSLLVTAAMALLQPYLVKAGEKVAETIGEKMAEKTLQQSFWQKVKGVFIKENEEEVIQAIEKKPISSSQDVAKNESIINKEVTTNPQFAVELKSVMNITAANEFIATEKIKSILRLKEEIKKLEVQMERAGIATSGDYINMIELKQVKLDYQISELSELFQQ